MARLQPGAAMRKEGEGRAPRAGLALGKQSDLKLPIPPLALLVELSILYVDLSMDEAGYSSFCDQFLPLDPHA